MTARVLVVDDDAPSRHLLQALLSREGHELVQAGDGAAALERIAQQAPDLVLLDLNMPEVDGFSVLAQLKGEEATRLIPVVVVSGSAQRAERLRALELGADECLTKPVDRVELRVRVAALLRLKRCTDQLERTANVMLLVARAVEARDPELGQHCERLVRWVTVTGRALGVAPAELHTLRLGAYLHDIGKIGIPDAVLLKPGPLDARERELMSRHPLLGESILAPLASMAAVLPLVRHHHERLDGSGYPDGLHGEQIPLLVRILSGADVLDALTTRRPYRDALPLEQALTVITQEVARGWWDAAVVACLARQARDLV